MAPQPVTVFLCMTSMAALAVGNASAASPPPTGTSYCANIQTLATVKVKIDSASLMDFSGTLEGNSTTCPNEDYTYDSTTGDISLTNILKPTDCVNQVVTKLGGDPTSVNFVYSSTANSIKMVGPAGNLTLTPAACSGSTAPFSNEAAQKKETAEIGASDSPAAGPTGQYCGSILTLASVKVKIDSATLMSVQGTYQGNTSTCPNEPYTYDATTGAIVVTKLLEPSDCVYQVFTKLGQNPKDVKVTYDAGANSMALQLSLGNLTLTPAGCNPAVVVATPAVEAESIII